METLNTQTCVRAFHVYRTIPEAGANEELECERGNQVRHYAVALVKEDMVVSHIPQKIHSYAPCSSGVVKAILVMLQERGGTTQSYLREDWTSQHLLMFTDELKEIK